MIRALIGGRESAGSRSRLSARPGAGVWAWAGLALAMASVAGCAGGGSVAIDRRTGLPVEDDPSASAPASAPAPGADGVRAEPAPWPGPIAFSTAAGVRMEFDSLSARAAAADVVILGERHDDAEGQAHAADLVEAVFARSGRAPALALEFLERDAQELVDDYWLGLADRPALEAALAARHRADAVVRRTLAGMTIDERTMGSWSLPEGHLRAMGAAREAGVPIIAANAPRRYVRHLREAGPEGFERLTPEQRRLVEDPGELTGGRYRDAFMGLMEGMAGHGAAERVDARAFYFAQNIWDATMADSVIDALDRGHRPVILIVGQFHSDDNGGVVQRIAEARPAASIYTVSYQPVFSPTLRQEDRTRAGAVVYTAPPSGDGDALME